jgi:hypothetical protein
VPLIVGVLIHYWIVRAPEPRLIKPWLWSEYLPQILCGVYRPTFRKNGEPGAPLHRLSGLEMENRIDPYSSREEPLLLGLRDGLEILTDVHPQPEVSLISGRNCGRDRLG